MALLDPEKFSASHVTVGTRLDKVSIVNSDYSLLVHQSAHSKAIFDPQDTDFHAETPDGQTTLEYAHHRHAPYFL